MSQITLEWDDDSASVLEQEDGRFFEIGTVVLNTLAFAIVGCTYHHHMIPLSNDSKYKTAHRQQLTQIKNELKSLQASHPEISVKHLCADASGDPRFLDLAIPLDFPIPLLLSDPYQEQVLAKITPYTTLLKSVHNLELIRRTAK
jgi:hypothetical protein